MAKIRLKKFLSGDAGMLIREYIASMGVSDCRIIDYKGDIVLGDPTAGVCAFNYPVIINGELIGSVLGGVESAVIAEMLKFLYSDELEKKALLDDSIERYRELTLVYKFSENLTGIVDIRKVADIAIEMAVNHIGASKFSVMLFDRDAWKLKILSSSEMTAGDEVSFRNIDGFYNSILLYGAGEIVNDTSEDERFFHMQTGGVALMCVPMKIGDSVVGLFEISREKTSEYSSDDFKLFTSLAMQTAVAIENCRLYGDLRDTFFFSVEVLAEAIMLKDPFMAGHSRRVADISIAIGRAMKLPIYEIPQLKLGALLHDVGKIGVSDSILLKRGQLDHKEKSELDKHPELGAKIIENIKQMKNIVPIVRHHHERFDGSGYPDRLKGDRIPLSSRIIAVADAYDNLVTEKSFKKGKSPLLAFGDIWDESGTGYDPRVIMGLKTMIFH